MWQVLEMHVTNVCLNCFICFLDVCCNRFNLDVAWCFLQVFHMYVLSVSVVFVRMLQVFHLVLEVDLVS